MTKRQLEELLQHEPFLQWLARRLLRDEARAQDVVQETWLAVLHSNKTPSEVHRGWLAGVLRNLARRKLREEGRRTRREQLVARPQAMPPEPSRLDAEELRVRLAKLVLRLPEHYREALLLRYYEGLEPVEIAERTGVSASTIRTRIQRGLDRIRGNLDSSTLSVAPLLQVIAAGRNPRGLRLLPIAAAAVVLVASLVALQGPHIVSRAPDRAKRHTTQTAERDSNYRSVRAERKTNRDEVTEQVIRDQPRRTLAGRIQLPYGVTNDAVSIELTVPETSASVRAVVRGEFSLDLSPLFKSGTPQSIQLSATHPECDTAERTLSPKSRVIHISLLRKPLFEPEFLVPALPEKETEPTAAEEESIERFAASTALPVFLEVTVRLPDDVAPEPIALAVCRDGRCLRFRVAAGRQSRLDVSSLLTGEPTSRLVVRAASRHTLTAQRTAPVWNGPRLEPLTLRLESGRIVSGRVAWENGAPGAGATVAVFRSPKMWDSAVDFEATRSPSAATTANAAGRFELVVPQGETPLLLALASGAMPASAPPSGNVQLVLREGATIRGRVPIRLSGSLVYLLSPTFTFNPIHTRYGAIGFGANGPYWRSRTTRIDTRGTFRFAGLEPGTYTVLCAGEQRDVVAPGQINISPVRDALAVIVTGDGLPLADARVTAANTTATATTTTASDGRATFDVFERADTIVRVDAEGYESIKHGVGGQREIVVDLRPAVKRGRLEVRVAAKGIPLLATAQVKLRPSDRNGTDATRTVAIKDGVIRVDALLPGTYKVGVDPGGWHFPASGVATIESGEVTRIELQPTAGGRIRADGASLRIEPAAMFQSIAQRSLDGDSTVSVPLSARAYTPDSLLEPGRYRLWFVPNTPTAQPRSLWIDVVAGKRIELAPDYN